MFLTSNFLEPKRGLMNTKRILISVVAGAMLTGSFAMAAKDKDQVRTRTKARTAKTTAVTTTTAGNDTVRTRNRVVTTAPTRTRTYSGYRTYSYGYPSYSSYGYGYPYYSYGPSFSFGYGYPYSYGYYPYSYNYGYYSYNRPGYAYSGDSVVVQVQSRLARAGYYHGPIDGVMGPGTRYAIRAYERTHGLRVDGVISGPLLRNMGLRY